MGKPKSLLVVDGRSFLRHVVETLAAGGCDPVLVIIAEGDRQIGGEAEAAGGTVLTNPDPGEGPITSFRLAIARLRGSVEAIAYLPVDHPAVRPQTVETLLDAAREAAAALVVPVHGSKRGHPAVFGAELFDELVDPRLEGGARTVVHRHLASALLVEVDDAGVVTDVDTPTEYEALIRRGMTSGASP